MAAPVRPETDKELIASLRGEVYLDDVGQTLEDQKKADAKAAEEAEAKRKATEQAKIDAEARAAIPADPRVKALEEALKISEEARRRTAAITAPATVTPKVEEKELTEEELKKLWDENPIAAIDRMLTKRDKVLETSFNQRFGALTSGNAATAREMAERKYPDEFKLFGKEINEFISTVPDADQRLTNSKSWDDLIAYIRGQPANFEKLLKDREEKSKSKAADDAHAQQIETAGAHTASTLRSPTPEGGTGLDDTEKEIARTLNPGMKPEQAYAEYVKWRKVAS